MASPETKSITGSDFLTRDYIFTKKPLSLFQDLNKDPREIPTTNWKGISTILRINVSSELSIRFYFNEKTMQHVNITPELKLNGQQPRSMREHLNNPQKIYFHTAKLHKTDEYRDDEAIHPSNFEIDYNVEQKIISLGQPATSTNHWRGKYAIYSCEASKMLHQLEIAAKSLDPESIGLRLIYPNLARLIKEKIEFYENDERKHDFYSFLMRRIAKRFARLYYFLPQIYSNKRIVKAIEFIPCSPKNKRGKPRTSSVNHSPLAGRA
jgi:hypothetical protein